MGCEGNVRFWYNLSFKLQKIRKNIKKINKFFGVYINKYCVEELTLFEVRTIIFFINCGIGQKFNIYLNEVYYGIFINQTNG